MPGWEPNPLARAVKVKNDDYLSKIYIFGQIYASMIIFNKILIL